VVELEKIPPLFQTTYKVALTSDYGRFRVGSIIARKNKIISLGTNARKTHPLQSRFTNKPYLKAWRHAEIHSLSLCGNISVSNCDIYVLRSLADNNLGNSRPCSGCMEALKHFGIARAFYWQDGKYCCEEIN
jgi:tRNA(Arg) A34 adenosine deaminase TadA